MSVSHTPKRYFTLEEANAYVPVLESWLADMQSYRETIEDLQDEMGPVLGNVHLDTGGPAASRFAVALHRLQAYAHRIREEGIQLRDVETGLVDFPSIRFEREVFLCWKRGEMSVKHWHELDGGYAGRQTLEPKSDDDDPTDA